MMPLQLIPDGFGVDHLELIREQVRSVSAAHECILHCCQMGPKNCQYVWIVWEKCYAVWCTESSRACDPTYIPPSENINSIYVQVMLTEPVVTPLTTPNSVVDDLLDEIAHEGASSNLSPVANAGPDIMIHFPEETSVTLDGTSSTDDQVRQVKGGGGGGNAGTKQVSSK